GPSSNPSFARSCAMRPIFPILMLAMASACATPSTPPSARAPVPPPLSATTAEPCPPLTPLATDTPAELIAWAAPAAVLYAQCQAKHAAAVGAYADARAAAIEANAND